VAGWTEEIVIVLNEEVRDGTEEIALNNTARKFSGSPGPVFATRKPRASTARSNRGCWRWTRMRRWSPELRAAIERFFAGDLGRFAGGISRARSGSSARWITHGDWYPDHVLRLFRAGAGEVGRLDGTLQRRVAGREDKIKRRPASLLESGH